MDGGFFKYPLVLVIPCYCGSFSALFQFFNERLQGFFCLHPGEELNAYAICVSNLDISLIESMLYSQISMTPSRILRLSSCEVDHKEVNGYSIEIKQAAIPDIRMARHMSILEKAEGYKVGVKTILAQVDHYYLLAEDILVCPIKDI